MKIAILNNCFFNTVHLDKLKTLGDVSIYENTNSPELAIERLKGADIAIVDQFTTAYTSNILEAQDTLKLLALNTTTFSDVDLKAAKDHGILVANVPGFSRRSVAELTIGLMFDVVRKISYGAELMKDTPFELDPENQDHQNFIGFDLYGKTLGILGLGAIGTTVAEIGKALGMNVIAYNRSEKTTNLKMVSLDDLLSTSDILSVHLALNDETTNFIEKEKLAKMKKGAVLISTARPEVTNLTDVHEALALGNLGGFGLDIGGKITKDSPLLKLDNVVLTPHLGSFTKEAFYQNLPNIIVENVSAFIKGNPQNIVNL